MIVNAGRFNWGLIFIILGLLALGWTTDRLPLQVFERLFDLWPILLIAFGIQMIFSRSKAPFLAYISSLIIIAGAVYAVVPYSDMIKNPEHEVSHGKIEESFSGSVDTVELRAHLKKREFTLDDFGDDGFELQFSRESAGPIIDLAEKKDVIRIGLYHRDRPWMRFWDNDDFPYWKMEIGHRYPLDLFINAERSYCYLRLADFNLHSLDLNCKRCYEVVVQFGRRFPDEPVSFDLLKSDLRLEIPGGYYVMLKDGVGLPFYVVDHLDFVEVGNDLVSDSLYHPDSLLILDIEPQVKSLQINWYE
jgi:hypothetical protein